eukprot:jgi/Bigna1/90373/estExt_fgenesh1_pg.C_680074
MGGLERNQSQPEPKHFVREWLDAKDEEGTWIEAQVVNIQEGRVQVHFKGYSSEWDEWYESNSQGLAKLHTHTKPICTRDTELGTDVKIDLPIGKDLDVMDTTDEWVPAKVVATDGKYDQVKVRYDGWESKYDEWIRTDSYRLAVAGRHTKKQRLKAEEEKRKKEQQLQEQEQRKQFLEEGGKRTNNLSSSSSRSRKRHGERGREEGNMMAVEKSNYDYKDNSSYNNSVHSSKEEKKGSSSSSSSHLPRIRYNTNSVEGKYRSALMRMRNFHVQDEDGDGNCLFRTISRLIYGTPEHHAMVRAKILEYIQTEAVFFGQYIFDEDFNQYLERMKQPGEWGGEVEIRAACEMYGRHVEIYAYSLEPKGHYQPPAADLIIPTSVTFKGGGEAGEGARQQQHHQQQSSRMAVVCEEEEKENFPQHQQRQAPSSFASQTTADTKQSAVVTSSTTLMRTVRGVVSEGKMPLATIQQQQLPQHTSSSSSSTTSTASERKLKRIMAVTEHSTPPREAKGGGVERVVRLESMATSSTSNSSSRGNNNNNNNNNNNSGADGSASMQVEQVVAAGAGGVEASGRTDGETNNNDSSSSSSSSYPQVRQVARGELPPLRLSFHWNSHYNSIIDCSSNSSFPIVAAHPGVIEDQGIQRAKRRQCKLDEMKDLQNALAASRRAFENRDLDQIFSNMLIGTQKASDRNSSENAILEKAISASLEEEEKKFKEAVEASRKEAERLGDKNIEIAKEKSVLDEAKARSLLLKEQEEIARVLEESRRMQEKRQLEEILKKSVATEGGGHHAFMEEDEDPDLQAALAASMEAACTGNT